MGSLAACIFAQQEYRVDLYEAREDIRSAEHQLAGRSINLALSVRGRDALRRIGLEEEILAHGIPMRARMIHAKDGKLTEIPYDPLHNQCIYSVNRKFLNQTLLSKLEEFPDCHLHFKHKMASLDVNTGDLTFCRSDNNEGIQISNSEVIIGADGAYSGVRKNLMQQSMFNFSQTYIEHGYMELCIPPSADSQFQMAPHYLHIWPRGTFMMIALPNQDHSWTVTLFMPFPKFWSIRSEAELLEFFDTQFPDAVSLIGKDRLVADFFSHKASPLISIKCNPYHKNNKILIIGDAAHAMVPFYGQGMNAGFEDCCILEDLLMQYDGDMAKVLSEFTAVRQKDAEAICDLAMYNYIEMRDLVNRSSFLWRKRLDSILFWLFPNFWIPLYNAVTFSRIRYSTCIQHKEFQDRIITSAVTGTYVLGALVLVYLILRFALFV